VYEGGKGCRVVWGWGGGGKKGRNLPFVVKKLLKEKKKRPRSGFYLLSGSPGEKRKKENKVGFLILIPADGEKG